MLDLKYLRENLDEVITRLNTRGEDFSHLKVLLDKDEKRREIIAETEKMKARRNEISKKIGEYKREGKDVAPILKTIEDSKQEVTRLDAERKKIENSIRDTLLITPNIPHKNIPYGESEDDNVELKKEGDIPAFDFEPKAHWDLARDLDILDFDRAAKIASSRFVIYKGLGAKLERALISFMLDLHTHEGGYEEMLLPFIVNEQSLIASGQFPKFKEDVFELTDKRKLFLNPTAEVPSINLHRDEILAATELPRRYAAFTTAFRQESGSAGRDTRGIIRLHQFNKVELIKFCQPEYSYEELDKMLKDSEKILQKLKIPYRIIELCSGDLGFAMAKTYDIEVYLPAYKTYREIGSISNAEDYQARRGNIRFKRDKDAKAEYVHTLNGSGLAVGRTVVAILENYQQADGSVIVPEVLRPYMNTDIIK